MPEVSIIVPVYKVELYLRRCVDSILAQTFTDFELILVDDGSPDNCPAICDEYARQDARVRVLHKKWGGVSSARNAGMSIASGQYIMFCDSDDYISCKWCEVLVNNVGKYPDSYVFGGIHAVLKDESEDISEIQNIEKYSVADFVLLQLNGKVGYVWNVIFRTDIIRNNGLCFRESSINEDLIFCMNYLLYMSYITYCGYNGYYYIQTNEGSLSRKYCQNGYKKWQEKYSLLKSFIEKYVNESKRIQYQEHIANKYMYLFLKCLENTFDKRSALTLLQKLRYNQRVIQTQEFKSCLQNYTAGKEDARYLTLLRCGNYYICYLYILCTQIKAGVLRLFRQ